MKIRLRHIYTLLFCIYLAAVAFLCFMQTENLPDISAETFLGIPIDKVLHFLMFLPYPVLSGMTFIDTERGLAMNLITLAVLVITGAGLAYGTEAIQAYTDYRSYETADFHADLIGMASGTAAISAYLIISRLKK